MEPPAISVVIPAHNAEGTLANTLVALNAQRLDVPYEVVVVDDGSTDSTPHIVERAEGPVRLVRQRNLGAAAARNHGVAAARAALLAFTDADCIPDPGWLRAGMLALEGADLIQGRVTPTRPVRSPFERTLNVSGLTELFQTANLFTTRRVFDRVGGFEAIFGPERGRPLGEDVLFGWRARRAGASVTFSPDALVQHVVFPGSARSFIAEHRRLGSFAAIVREIPELRRKRLVAGVFLTRRTAEFDAAAGGALAAIATQTLWPLLLGGPYALRLLREVAGWRRWAPYMGTVIVTADLVGCVSLLSASARHRSAVL